MNWTVEVLRDEELPEVLALLERNGLPEAGLADHVGTTLVLRAEDGQIRGSGAVELYGEVALLRSVAVAHDCRGLGLGRRITRDVLAFARERGAREVFLLTETAEPFFADLGFAIVRREDVPAAIRTTVEFSSACPASAAVMRLPFVDSEPGP